MTPKIVFENEGEIDLASVTTFGVNVKDNDNPIGYFGTGLKYAIAILLREGQSIQIDSGAETLRFDLRDETVRGKVFKIPYANGQRMAFTSELGKNWELWQAHRELYCNCKDERGNIYESPDTITPTPGITRVTVEGKEFSDVHRERHQFLLEDEPDFLIGDVEVRRRPSKYLFFKGIRIMQFPRPTMFTYNILNGLEITEDRTAKCAYTATHKAARSWLQAAPDDLQDLTRALIADTESQEAYFDYHGWGELASETFLDAVGVIQRERLGLVNQTALKVWREQGKGKFAPQLAEVCPVHRKMLDRAKAFCSSIGYPVGDYPIVVCHDLGGGLQAYAADGTIFLTTEVFSKGTKYLARALIEEWAHLRFGFSDSSRDFQNWIFDKLIDALEQVKGEPL